MVRGYGTTSVDSSTAKALNLDLKVATSARNTKLTVPSLIFSGIWHITERSWKVSVLDVIKEGTEL